MTGFEPAASCSQSRRATNCATPGYFVILSGWSYSPKSSAIPTSLHPDIHFSAIISRRRRKSKIFLSVVIYVVKAAFVPLSAIGGNPANAGVTRLCGVSPCPVPDTATALPNVGAIPTPPYPDRGGGTPPDHGRRTLTISGFLRSCKGKMSRCRAAFRAATRSVASQRTPRSSRPMWP